MNFPMDLPLFRFLYWLVNTAGVGSAVVGLIATVVITGYGLTLRWIAAGAKADERATYLYPAHE
ncbi:MAG: hypothetical protein AUK03_10115 [Anaerolineae bacterium CG2_30_64_16]|nr:MAG: hypothetical protein AUK03_10115 [Anaerolineae bacterium CG2_30_64_16]